MKTETNQNTEQVSSINILLCDGRDNTKLLFSDFTDLGFVPMYNRVESDDTWSFEKSYLQGIYIVELIYTNDFRKRLEVICREVGKDNRWHLCTGISIDAKGDLIWLINHLYILRRFNDTV